MGGVSAPVSALNYSSCSIKRTVGCTIAPLQYCTISKKTCILRAKAIFDTSRPEAGVHVRKVATSLYYCL